MPASRHSTFSLASLYIFRNWGICKLNISVGLTPFSLATSWTWSINGQGWVKYAFATPAVARYISVTALGQTGGNLLEMAVYGNLTSPTNPNPPAGTAPTAPPLGLLLGLNAVTGTDVSLMAGVTGAIRENQVCCSREMTTVVMPLYATERPPASQNWEWTEPASAQDAFQPTSTGVSLDSWYANLSSAGIAVHQSFRTTPSWIHAGSEAGWKPLTNAQLSASFAASDPLQYTSIAAHAYQVRSSSPGCAALVVTLLLAYPPPFGAGRRALRLHFCPPVHAHSR